MNIGIVGAGTASAISILTIIDAMNNHPNKFRYTNLYCIHDPNMPTAQVGESASPYVYALINRVLGTDFSEDLDKYDGTLRYYAKYFWTEAVGKDFCVYHTTPGVHLNSQTFSNYVFEKLKKRYPYFSIITDTVKSVTNGDNQAKVSCTKVDYNFDFVIDARGTPSNTELDSDAYCTDVFESVNSVILYPEFKSHDEPYTGAYVHNNGWMFGVPLTHRKAFGYLYNNKITSQADACQDFERIKGIDTANLRKFSWRPYYKRNAMDGRIFSTGNRLYFFEPHQAIPLHYYVSLMDLFIHEVVALPLENLNYRVNTFHNDRMEQVQNLIALGYCSNKIESEFWQTIKPKAVNQLLNSKDWQAWLLTVKSSSKILDYYTHSAPIMKFYIEGFNIDLDSLENPNFLSM